MLIYMKLQHAKLRASFTQANRADSDGILQSDDGYFKSLFDTLPLSTRNTGGYSRCHTWLELESGKPERCGSDKHSNIETAI